MARQPDNAPKGAGVKALSSRLLQMKFMKRGQAAETTPQAASTSAPAAKVMPYRAIFTQTSKHWQSGLKDVNSFLMALTRALAVNICAGLQEEPISPSGQAEKVPEDERWVARTPQSGCIIISEPDPPPGALLGHMTFGGFNPAIEQLQVRHTAGLRALLLPDLHQQSSALPAVLSGRQCNDELSCTSWKQLNHLYEDVSTNGSAERSRDATAGSKEEARRRQ